MEMRQDKEPQGTIPPGDNPLHFIRRRSDRAVIYSLIVLAILGLLTLFYFASSVFITLFSSLLIAFALEPIVQFLCRLAKLRRALASGIVVFLSIALLYGLAYFAYGMAEGFVSDAPAFVEKIRSAPLMERASKKMDDLTKVIDEAGSHFTPGARAGKDKGTAQVVVRDSDTLTGTLFHGLGSLTGVIFSLSFIPFLVYFMLADREPLTHRTLEFFPEEHRGTAKEILNDIERMMRKFLLGNAIVAGILSVATIAVFWLAGLPYPIVLGGMSGTLSIVPYLGLPLALLPGVAIGLITFSSGFPFFVVVLSVTIFHLVAANYLTPKIVGHEVHVNATASTMALLFFGWLWGGMGLLLAIPILAVLKCVLENVPATRTLGEWLGD